MSFNKRLCLRGRCASCPDPFPDDVTFILYLFHSHTSTNTSRISTKSTNCSIIWNTVQYLPVWIVSHHFHELSGFVWQLFPSTPFSTNRRNKICTERSQCLLSCDDFIDFFSRKFSHVGYARRGRASSANICLCGRDLRNKWLHWRLIHWITLILIPVVIFMVVI